MSTSNVTLSLPDGNKKTTDPVILNSRFAEIRDFYSDYSAAYTDGSKDGETVGAAVVARLGAISTRHTSDDSIFSTELNAISMTLDTIFIFGMNSKNSLHY